MYIYAYACVVTNGLSASSLSHTKAFENPGGIAYLLLGVSGPCGGLTTSLVYTYRLRDLVIVRPI